MLRTAEIKKHNSPEDVAALYVVRLLEGYHTKATVDQAYIDICRLETGRKGQPGYEAKKCLNSLALTEEQQDHADLQPSLLDGLSIDDMIDLKALIKKIEHPKTKLVFHYWLQGYTLLEIGEMLDLSMGRIQQIVSLEIQALKETC